MGSSSRSSLGRAVASVLLVLAAGCERKAPSSPPIPREPMLMPAPPADAGSVDAATPIVDAPAPLVDLLRSVPATITVSSIATKRGVKPEHLVDGKSATAWTAHDHDDNIQISVELASPDIVIHELRLTVTGHPRIQTIEVQHGSRTLGRFALDIANRAQQIIPLRAKPGNETLTITIAKLAPRNSGTRSNASIAELEVWGTAPPGSTVFVPRVLADTLMLAWPLCRELVPEPDSEYPECTLDSTYLSLPAPWGPPVLLEHVTSRQVYHGHLYDETVETSLVLASHGTAWLGPRIETSTYTNDGSGNVSERSEVTVVEASLEQVVPGGAPEAILRYEIDDAGAATELIVVCTADRRCTPPYPVKAATWAVDVRFTGGTLVRTVSSGSPPLDVLAPARLVFQAP